jgi:hypothetical protein
MGPFEMSQSVVTAAAAIMPPTKLPSSPNIIQAVDRAITTVLRVSTSLARPEKQVDLVFFPPLTSVRPFHTDLASKTLLKPLELVPKFCSPSDWIVTHANATRARFINEFNDRTAINRLPFDVCIHIFQYLPLSNRIRVATVCSRWHNWVATPCLWNRLEVSDLNLLQLERMLDYGRDTATALSLKDLDGRQLERRMAVHIGKLLQKHIHRFSTLNIEVSTIRRDRLTKLLPNAGSSASPILTELRLYCRSHPGKAGLKLHRNRLWTMPFLKVLIIEGLELEDTFLEALSEHPHLEEFAHLGFHGLKQASRRALLTACPNLKKLSLTSDIIVEDVNDDKQTLPEMRFLETLHTSSPHSDVYHIQTSPHLQGLSIDVCRKRDLEPLLARMNVPVSCQVYSLAFSVTSEQGLQLNIAEMKPRLANLDVLRMPVICDHIQALCMEGRLLWSISQKAELSPTLLLPRVLHFTIWFPGSSHVWYKRRPIPDSSHQVRRLVLPALEIVAMENSAEHPLRAPAGDVLAFVQSCGIAEIGQLRTLQIKHFRLGPGDLEVLQKVAPKLDFHP